MQKNIKMPIWVLLAFSSIHKRKHALWLIGATVLFALYCIPWGSFFANQPIVSQLFLIEDWSWFAMMVPITLWYVLCLRWMDRHEAW